jgi:endo-1,4-beta-xylanase
MMKRRFLLIVPLFVLAIVSVLFFAHPVPATQSEIPSTSLRSLASQQGFFIGSAVGSGILEKDAQYREVLAREFNTLTTENEVKFNVVHPDRDRYDFTRPDALVTFAQEHNMLVRGHTIVWFHSLPRWLTEGEFTGDELKEILREHIQTLVGHYRGQIQHWDVVNEPLEADGSLRDTIWMRGIGPDYIDLAFRWTHEADPDARLYLTDYGEGLSSKGDAFYALAKQLKERGVPIDGVGFQAHVGFLSAKDPKEVAENMKRLNEAGLEVVFTELDIPINMKKFTGSFEQKLKQQAELYQYFLQICLEASNCNTFNMWGFTDRYTWLKSFLGTVKAPLIFDEDFQPKPAYHALTEELQKYLGKR